jgi:hypothetical protein
LPPELEHVWEWFILLDRRRQIGMVACPVSEMQVEAFARLRGLTITPLEFDLLCRVDDAVLAVGSKPPSNPDAVPTSDGAGAAALMRGMGAKKRTKQSSGADKA